MPKPSKAEAEIREALQRYEAVCAALFELNHPRSTDLAAGLMKSLAQVREILGAKPRPAPLGVIRTGFLQGYRELPNLLRAVLADVSPAAQAGVWLAFDSPGVSGGSDFMTAQADKAQEVLRRGTVRNDDEWYLLRWRLDQIEGHTAHHEEITSLSQLMDSYEVTRGPKRR